MCGPASPKEIRCRHDRSDRWGDDAIWRETVTLAFWETGPVRWSFLPSPMLRPLFTRSWAGLPVRCDRPPLPAQAHPVRAGRMILVRCLPSRPFHRWGWRGRFIPMDRPRRHTGLPSNSVPPVLRAGTSRGRANVPTAIRCAGTGEPDVIAAQTSDFMYHDGFTNRRGNNAHHAL